MNDNTLLNRSNIMIDVMMFLVSKDIWLMSEKVLLQIKFSFWQNKKKGK